MKKSNKLVPNHNFPCLQWMGRTAFTYENVGINRMRSQVVSNTISYLGRLNYNAVKSEFQGIVTERYKQGIPTSYTDYEGWMSDLEMWGLGQLVPLALEWGLDAYIGDWEKHFDEWLDLYPTLQEAA